MRVCRAEVVILVVSAPTTGLLSIGVSTHLSGRLPLRPLTPRSGGNHFHDHRHTLDPIVLGLQEPHSVGVAFATGRHGRQQSAQVCIRGGRHDFTSASRSERVSHRAGYKDRS